MAGKLRYNNRSVGTTATKSNETHVKIKRYLPLNEEISKMNKSDNATKKSPSEQKRKNWMIIRMYYYAKSGRRGFGGRTADSVICGFWLVRPEWRKVMQMRTSCASEEALNNLIGHKSSTRTAQQKGANYVHSNTASSSAWAKPHLMLLSYFSHSSSHITQTMLSQTQLNIFLQMFERGARVEGAIAHVYTAVFCSEYNEHKLASYIHYSMPISDPLVVSTMTSRYAADEKANFLPIYLPSSWQLDTLNRSDNHCNNTTNYTRYANYAWYAMGNYIALYSHYLYDNARVQRINSSTVEPRIKHNKISNINYLLPARFHLPQVKHSNISTANDGEGFLKHLENAQADKWWMYRIAYSSRTHCRDASMRIDKPSHRYRFIGVEYKISSTRTTKKVVISALPPMK